MQNKNPPFTITAAILDEITDIAELVGQVSATPGLTANPTLRRTNRIRTIYSSLAIEQNTLSLDQVTAVLNGKRVLAPPKDVAEVKNAYEIYERILSAEERRDAAPIFLYRRSVPFHRCASRTAPRRNGLQCRQPRHDIGQGMGIAVLRGGRKRTDVYKCA